MITSRNQLIINNITWRRNQKRLLLKIIKFYEVNTVHYQRQFSCSQSGKKLNISLKLWDLLNNFYRISAVFSTNKCRFVHKKFFKFSLIKLGFMKQQKIYYRLKNIDDCRFEIVQRKFSLIFRFVANARFNVYRFLFEYFSPLSSYVFLLKKYKFWIQTVTFHFPSIWLDIDR